MKKSVEAATKVIKLGVYELSDAINNAFVIDSKYYTDYQVMWMRDASDEVIWKIGMSSTSYGGALGKNYCRIIIQPIIPDIILQKQSWTYMMRMISVLLYFAHQQKM